jgi:hypothetical protein
MQFSRFEMREVMLLMPSYRAIKNTVAWNQDNVSEWSNMSIC